ncbi:MAG: TIGR03564 family F420-dependent LLM class oxidoreductase [Actinomycetota bacterium]
MNIGITVGLGARSEGTIDGVVDRIKDAEARGFASVWMTNAFSFDAITALSAAGRETSRVELGTAVVPTYPRHPVVMAQQALTAQSASDGRFTLGIGLSHETMVTNALGLPFERPAQHMREYLQVMMPLLSKETASVNGEFYRVQARVGVGDVAPVPVVLAALGPRMLKIAGTMTAGTITSWVGPRTLESHIAPKIAEAATAAGRPGPRIIIGLPISLTSDPDAARQRFGPQVAGYGMLPSYRAMFDHEGVEDPAEIAMFGDEAALGKALSVLEEAGATDFAAQVVATEPGSATRTLEFLASV